MPSQPTIGPSGPGPDSSQAGGHNRITARDIASNQLPGPHQHHLPKHHVEPHKSNLQIRHDNIGLPLKQQAPENPVEPNIPAPSSSQSKSPATEQRELQAKARAAAQDEQKPTPRHGDNNSDSSDAEAAALQRSRARKNRKHVAAADEQSSSSSSDNAQIISPAQDQPCVTVRSRPSQSPPNSRNASVGARQQRTRSVSSSRSESDSDSEDDQQHESDQSTDTDSEENANEGQVAANKAGDKHQHDHDHSTQEKPVLNKHGKVKQRRVGLACTNCKAAKTRCDNKRPCNRCSTTGRTVSCVDGVHRKRGRKRQKKLMVPSNNTSGSNTSNNSQPAGTPINAMPVNQLHQTLLKMAAASNGMRGDAGVAAQQASIAVALASAQERQLQLKHSQQQQQQQQQSPYRINGTSFTSPAAYNKSLQLARSAGLEHQFPSIPGFSSVSSVPMLPAAPTDTTLNHMTSTSGALPSTTSHAVPVSVQSNASAVPSSPNNAFGYLQQLQQLQQQQQFLALYNQHQQQQEYIRHMQQPHNSFYSAYGVQQDGQTAVAQAHAPTMPQQQGQQLLSQPDYLRLMRQQNHSAAAAPVLTLSQSMLQSAMMPTMQSNNFATVSAPTQQTNSSPDKWVSRIQGGSAQLHSGSQSSSSSQNSSPAQLPPQPLLPARETDATTAVTIVAKPAPAAMPTAHSITPTRKQAIKAVDTAVQQRKERSLPAAVPSQMVRPTIKAAATVDAQLAPWSEALRNAATTVMARLNSIITVLSTSGENKMPQNALSAFQWCSMFLADCQRASNGEEIAGYQPDAGDTAREQASLTALDSQKDVLNGLPMGVACFCLWPHPLKPMYKPWVSPALAERLGYKAEELAEKISTMPTMATVYHYSNLEMILYKFIEAVCHGAKQYALRTKWIHKDGYLVEVEELNTINYSFSGSGLPIWVTTLVKYNEAEASTSGSDSHGANFKPIPFSPDFKTSSTQPKDILHSINHLAAAEAEIGDKLSSLADIAMTQDHQLPAKGHAHTGKHAFRSMATSSADRRPTKVRK